MCKSQRREEQERERRKTGGYEMESGKDVDALGQMDRRSAGFMKTRG